MTSGVSDPLQKEKQKTTFKVIIVGERNVDTEQQCKKFLEEKLHFTMLKHCNGNDDIKVRVIEYLPA
jgi:hypothetical protein